MCWVQFRDLILRHLDAKGLNLKAYIEAIKALEDSFADDLRGYFEGLCDYVFQSVATEETYLRMRQVRDALLLCMARTGCARAMLHAELWCVWQEMWGCVAPYIQQLLGKFHVVKKVGPL